MNVIGGQTKYPYQIDLPRDGQMPFSPDLGAVMLFVDLNESGNFADTVQVLNEMQRGYELRWAKTPKGELRLCALICYDQHDPTIRPSGDYLFELQDWLWERLPKDSVVLRCRGVRELIAA
jgi:hypothetical protein